MDINKQYSKLRKTFGKQLMLCETPPCILDSINPDRIEQKKFILRNPVSTSSQATLTYFEHYVNTKRVKMTTQGNNHKEGGWPKEIHINDEEAVQRYKRRIEKDDSYINFVLASYNKLHKNIQQNNAIEMYNMYFSDFGPIEPVETCSVRVTNCFRDRYKRPISCICWTLEEDPKLVVAYCDRTYPFTNNLLNEQTLCYVWDLDSPLDPSAQFLPPAACWQVACSPVQPAIILGGLNDGRVCVFDLRSQNTPVSLSPLHLAHRDPVSALLYIHSRHNTEFFSGSSDGSCMWWDFRDLSKPFERIIMAVKVPPGEEDSIAHAEPVSVLQFDKSIPTRFLCGTDTGLVINVNRKGKTRTEMMSAIFNAHSGPVKALHRSPCAPKMFLTCGDWTIHIWSDDIHISPIITGISHRYQINDAIWCPNRYSSYISVGADGFLRIWDILRRGGEPILMLKISNSPLLKIKSHEEGRIIAIGNSLGSMYTLSLSPSLFLSGDQDKPLVVQNFEREAHREHILEARVKEIRLKLRQEEETVVQPVESVNEESVLKAAEEVFKKTVSDELRQFGDKLYTSEGLRKR